MIGVDIKLDERALEHRKLMLDIVGKSKRGHVASAFSLMEIVRVLFDDILNYDPKNPTWPDRDRFIFSKGHGCLALYVMLAEKGFFPKEQLYTFCKFGSMLGGHPEADKIPGVEASTGALGHGLPIAVGCALNQRIDKKDYRTFVVMGDGECNEGTVWEAALSAGKHKLRSLTVLIDYNKMQSYGRTFQIQDLEPFVDKWRSFGFAIEEIDGHDPYALKAILQRIPFASDKPSVIICHTIKGKGIPSIESSSEWHHKSRLDMDQVEGLQKELGRKS